MFLNGCANNSDHTDNNNGAGDTFNKIADDRANINAGDSMDIIPEINYLMIMIRIGEKIIFFTALSDG